jgi:outer membrane protein TolC
VLEQNLLVTKNKYEMFFADTSINPSGIFFPVEPNIDVMQDENFNSIYENYPMVKSTREAIETAILEIDALSRAKFGSFFLEGSTSKVGGSLSTSAQDSQSIMLVFRSNVFSGGAHSAKIDEAKAKLAQQKIQLEQLKKDYLLAFNQSKSNYLKEQKTFLSTKEIVDQSMLSFKGTLELFFARKGGLLDVFSIQESIFSAGSLMVNSFVNKTLAKYRYMHVTGQLLDYIYPKI